MKPSQTFIAFTVSLLILMSGCTGRSLRDEDGLHRDLRPARWVMADQWRVRAADFEAQEDLYRSLYYWNLVNSLIPGDGSVAQVIARLEGKRNEKVNRHWQRAQALARKQKWEEARNEYLAVLALVPDHTPAMDRVRKIGREDTWQHYHIKKGDTFASIAEQLYGESSKGVLIACLNELKEPLPEGEMLRIPLRSDLQISVSEEKPIKRTPSTIPAFAYQDSLSSFQPTPDYWPDEVISDDTKNEALYRKGEQLLKEQKLNEALEMFAHVDPGYKDSQIRMRAIQEQLIKQAEFHYRRGLEHFVHERLEGAIMEWNQALALNPDHSKARRDLENARGLLEKLKNIP